MVYNFKRKSRIDDYIAVEADSIEMALDKLIGYIHPLKIMTRDYQLFSIAKIKINEFKFSPKIPSRQKQYETEKTKPKTSAELI